MTQQAIEWGGDDVGARVAACYDRSIHDIYRYLHRATAGDRRLTEDLTQETFMACVRAVREGVPDATTLPWLMGVARHKMIDHYRRRSRDERKLSLAWSVRDDDSSPFVEVTDTQALDALRGLSPLHRMVLILRYVDDLSVNHVAAEIGRSVRATESLIVRARHALEQSLQEVSDV